MLFDVVRRKKKIKNLKLTQLSDGVPLNSINVLTKPAKKKLKILTSINQSKTDDILVEREKNKMLQEEMEATLHDIQNM